MKIIRNNFTYTGKESVGGFRHALKKYPFVEIASLDERDHVAGYIAWKEVGGVLFVKNMWQSDAEQQHVLEQVRKNTQKDVIIFNTSGTTGTPKLAKFTKEDLARIEQTATKNLRWTKDTVYCNVLPAFSSGFWFLVLLSCVEQNGTVVCSSKQTLKEDFEKYPVTLTTFVPGMIDYLRVNKIKLPLEKLDTVSTGSSQLLPRHVQFCFDTGARSFMNTYGTTEIGAPVLIHESFSMDEYVDCLAITNEIAFDNEELIYNGIPTGDLFEFVTANLIRFKGRKNDIVNINGATCSLIKAENEFENLNKYGECLAVVRQKMGIDFIEMYYTQGKVNKDEVVEQLSKVLPRQGVPRKYTKIDAIPRNAMNKKVRRAL